MEEIRVLRQNELDESISLSCFAFQYELTPAEREERKLRMKPERTWGYFINDKLAAKMTIHELSMYIQGKPYRMGGVASVATWPEYRRKGMVGQLLRRGLEEMRREGRSLSCLHPFSIPFYRRYGWELYTDYKTYKLTAAQLPARTDVAAGRMERADGDWELLDRVYRQFAKTYNGTILRDADWWQHMVFKQKGRQAAVYYNPQGVPRGYILYQVKDRVMDIGELTFLDEEAREGLWQFIANHDSMCDTYKLKAPADDELPYLLPDPRISQETTPYFMARIVDFKSFVEDYSFQATGETSRLAVQLSDLHAPWNDGLFEITVRGDGTASVKRLENHSASDEALSHVACGIGTMAAMLMGYKRPAFMRRTGRLTGDAGQAAMWDKLIPNQSSYLPDYY